MQWGMYVLYEAMLGKCRTPYKVLKMMAGTIGENKDADVQFF
jgi:hypothetical protein